MKEVPVHERVMVYPCDVCDFSSDDPRAAQQHLREMNRHLQSKWWRHGICVTPHISRANSSKAKGGS